MDCADWPLALGEDAAAMLDAALALLDDDAPVADRRGLGLDAGAAPKAANDSMEPAAVTATLAFLAEYDTDLESDDPRRSSTATGGAAGVSAAPEAPVKPARRNRVRPKQELARLRRQEGELASRLRDLRLEARRQAERPRAGDGGQSRGRASALLFWERAAARQLRHRQQSEQERRRLTGLLRAQLRLARQLQQALNRQATASRGSAVETGSPGWAARRAPASNAAVFSALLGDIDAVYAGLDAFMAALLPPRLGSRDGADSCSLDSKAFALGHDQDSTVPFELRAVQLALWESMGCRLKRRNESFRRTFVHYAGDVLETSASSVLPNGGDPFVLQLQMVARTYHEPDRVVVISISRIEPRGFERGLPLGAIFTETNVRELTPVRSDGEAFTTVRVRASLTRQVLDGPLARYWVKAEDDAPTEAVWKRTLAARRELLEELLVRAASG